MNGPRAVIVLVSTALLGAGCTPGPWLLPAGTDPDPAPSSCRKVAHIIVKDHAEALRIRRAVVAGDEDAFAALAREHSIDDGTNRDGGVFDVCRGQTVPEFDRAAFRLRVGETSQPVRTAYGWSIIQVRAELPD